VVQTIEQDALKQFLKRVKNSVDKDTYNDHRQYDGEDHLFGIEFFHEQFESTLMLQKSRMPQMQDGKGEAVVNYREPFPTQQMGYHRLSQRANNTTN